MDATQVTDATAHIGSGLDWTAARIAAVRTDMLESSTPCGRWSLRDLLDHLLDTSGVFADALDPPGPGSASVPAKILLSDAALPWQDAFGDISTRTREGWAGPGALERTYDVRFGVMPGPVMAGANLLEVVVHGWDVAQATGEALDIPDVLAEPILEFARAAIGDDQRGDAFGRDLGDGDTPGRRLVSFLGRSAR